MRRVSEFIDFFGPLKGVENRTESHAYNGDALRATCTCYPSNPELRQGCGHENECWVLGNARRANNAGRLGLKLERASERPLDPESPRAHALRRLSRLIPLDALESAQKDFPTKAAARVAAESWWIGDKGAKPALVLAGPTGVAKSSSAALAALKWGEQWQWAKPSGGKQNPPFVWLDGPDLQRIAGFDANAAMILDAAEAAHMLVIDDAATEGTAKAAATLSDVIRARCDQRRLTVLTTNVTFAAFRARYGDPLADRLRVCAVAPDLRGEKSMRGAA